MGLSSPWVPFLSSDNHQKVFYPLFAGCVEILYEIFHNGRRTDRTLDYHFKKQKKWGARDRRWVAEQVYGCVREWRHNLACLDHAWTDNSLAAFSETGPRPERELVNKALKVFLLKNGRDLSGFQETDPEWNKLDLVPQHLASDWFYQLGVRQLQNWDAILMAQNTQAPAYLRVNFLKAPDLKACQDRLKSEGVVTGRVEGCDSALMLEERKNIFQTRTFTDGWVEMQDLASQQVAPLLDPKPGERVVDACAGAGGKSLHLAERMSNKGQLIALDIHEWKLNELKQRGRRAGISNIETRAVTSSKVIKRLKASADALLLDVPCTGSGVLRRNPDPKWRLNPKEYEATLQLQRNLLSSYSSMLKPGGRMVYSTCSALPEENKLQVEDFLKTEAGNGFELLQEFINQPDTSPGDGFYAALLKLHKSD